MALDSNALAQLRWSIAKSRRRQETYLDTVGDSMVLAAQQVQDMRIELLERGPEISASERFVDFLIGLACSMGGELIEQGLVHFITWIVRFRPLAAVVGQGVGVNQPFQVITADAIKQAGRLEVNKANVGIAPGTAPESPYEKWFKRFAKEALGITLERAKGALSGTGGQRPSAPNEEKGGDTPGVALTDTVLSFIRQQQAAVSLVHDMLDLQVTSGLMDDKAVKGLSDMVNASLATNARGLDLRDVTELKHQLKRFFEACIWASLFPVKSWPEARTEISLTRGEVFYPYRIQPEVPPPQPLQRYWIARFQTLPTFPRYGPPTMRLREFFTDMDRKLTDGIVQVVRSPKQITTGNPQPEQ
jgi:hypothetical protein